MAQEDFDVVERKSDALASRSRGKISANQNVQSKLKQKRFEELTFTDYKKIASLLGFDLISGGLAVNRRLLIDVLRNNGKVSDPKIEFNESSEATIGQMLEAPRWICTLRQSRVSETVIGNLIEIQSRDSEEGDKDVKGAEGGLGKLAGRDFASIFTAMYLGRPFSSDEANRHYLKEVLYTNERFYNICDLVKKPEDPVKIEGGFSKHVDALATPWWINQLRAEGIPERVIRALIELGVRDEYDLKMACDSLKGTDKGEFSEFIVKKLKYVLTQNFARFM